MDYDNQKKNKKAQFAGVFFLLLAIAVIVVGGVLMFIGGNFLNELITPLGDEGVLTAEQAIATQQELQNDTIPIFDNLGFWLVIAFGIGVILIAVYADYHPALMILGVLLLALAVYLAMQGANIYDQIATDSSYEGEGFSLMNFAFGPMLPIIIIVFGIIALIILYGKRKDSGAF